MPYIKPSVRVYQDFQTFSPAIITPDLDVLLMGPCYQFQTYEEDKILSDAGLDYVGAPIASMDYPSQFIGSEIVTSETEVYLDDATLIMHSSADENGLEVTAAKPEMVTGVGLNFSTVKGRGVLPGDKIILKKDATLGVASSLTDQTVTYASKVKGTVGDSITVELVDPASASSPLAVTVVGTDISVSLETDGGSAILTDIDALVAAIEGDTDAAALITVTGSGATLLTALAQTNLSGGVNQVDGDEFETLVMKSVTTLTSKDSLILQDSAPASFQVSGLDYEIHITAQDLKLASSDFLSEVDGLTLNAGITVDVEGVETTPGVPYSMDIVTGKIYVAYRALRKDLSAEITDLYDTNSISGVLGTIDPRNPLAYAALKAAQNTTARVRVIGVGSDDQVGFQSALDLASTVDTVYALVPLTQDPVINAAVSTHCEQFSTPNEGKWRICLINEDLTTVKYLTDLITVPQATIVDDGEGNFRRVEDVDGEFVSSGLVPTDVLEIGGEEYIVEEVINQTVLFIAEGPDSAISSATDYKIRRDLSKTQQAEDIAAKAGAFGRRRTFYIWPAQVGDGGNFVPGYYLAAAIGGMVAGFPPHKGFTNVGIVGFDDVGQSNRYFNETQLNIMAEQGVYIVVQDAPGAIPYSRHQMSTDAAIVEFREMSITKNIDFLSYFFKRRLATFIGDWNITPQTLLAIEQFVNGLIDFLLADATEKIGAPLLSGSISKLAQHETLKDQVDLFIDISIPYPLNNLNVHLVI